MRSSCTKAQCPNAHGFAEIRGAIADASPICWRWLEGRCRMAHCKYAHTFRRHHRLSVDAPRRGDAQNGSVANSARTSQSDDAQAGTPGARVSMGGAANGAAHRAAAPFHAPPGRGSMDFASRKSSAKLRNSLDVTGSRRASFGHSRASIDGPKNGSWRKPVASLDGAGSMDGVTVAAGQRRQSLTITPPHSGGLQVNGQRNFAMDSAFTRPAKMPSKLQQSVSHAPHGNGAAGNGVLDSTMSERSSLVAARKSLQAASPEAELLAPVPTTGPPARRSDVSSWRRPTIPEE